MLKVHHLIVIIIIIYSIDNWRIVEVLIFICELVFSRIVYYVATFFQQLALIHSQGMIDNRRILASIDFLGPLNEWNLIWFAEALWIDLLQILLLVIWILWWNSDSICVHDHILLRQIYINCLVFPLTRFLNCCYLAYRVNRLPLRLLLYGGIVLEHLFDQKVVRAKRLPLKRIAITFWLNSR